MKRIAYLCDEIVMRETTSLGVRKKILSQVRALENAGFECKLTTYRAPHTSLQKALRRLPFVPEAFSWPSPQCLSDTSVLYVRNPGITASFIRYLKSVKNHSSDITILLEFPSYPYDGEFVGFSGRPLLFKEEYNRRYIAKYIDACFTFSTDEVIFGIPAYRIINGIDLDGISLRTPVLKQDDSLDLICVAVFNEWHGIDRVIRGMADYRNNGGTRGVRLHLVGDGPAIEAYHTLVNRLGVEDSIVFHGRMLPDDYGDLFDCCDLAVECLGCHRKGVLVSSSLKSREYLARGMPFIYSGSIDVFQENPVDFCLQLPSDESPVDINTVFNFYDGLCADNSILELAKRMRLYAEDHVSMDVAMRPVAKYIRELQR